MSSAPPAPPGSVQLTLPQAVQLAFQEYQRGRWPDAENLCRLVLQAKGDAFDVLHLLGLITVQTGRLEEAEGLFRQALRANPDSADAHNNLGNALRALKRFPEALASYEKAVALKPELAATHNNRGTALQDLGRLPEALASFDRALALNPSHAGAHNSRGMVLHDLGQDAKAVECFDRAIALRPDYPDAHNNRGVALQRLHRHAEALEAFDRALALQPESPEYQNNRGNAMRELKRHADALACYEHAIALRPDFAEAHNSRGAALAGLKRHGEALESYARAIQLSPRYAEAHNNRGNALSALKRHAEAAASFEEALRIEPDFPFLLGAWLGAKLQVCSWTRIAEPRALLAEKIGRGEKAAPPFAALSATESPAALHAAARTWVEDNFPPGRALPAIARHPARERLRIGYFSADFHDHATMRLMAGLLERHDKSRFHLTGFSFGPETGDAVRQRVARAFDEFIDVREMPDVQVASLARERGIDIAVDLKGFTEDGRPGIFAQRAAPIQVNYLGFPGTMGAEYIDYIIGDAIVVPEAHRPHYTEKIACLPHCYQPNDATRSIAERPVTRAEWGLPAVGFVFCCFNNNYKITPEVFDVWMRLLGQCEGSVLWLFEENREAAGNLRSEASLRGVDPDRLVFAPRLPLPEHLARHAAADLFLDTLPVNAHTTASDALWAGLPLLTRRGEAFAGRVAASLLEAAGLPELVTTNKDDYERVALDLATDPVKLQAIRERLAHARLNAPLFDGAAYARHLEAAYVAMAERYQAGLPPAHIHVPR